MGLDSVVSKHLEILDLGSNLCPKQNFSLLLEAAFFQKQPLEWSQHSML